MAGFIDSNHSMKAATISMAALSAAIIDSSFTLSIAKPWLMRRCALCAYAWVSSDRRPVAGPSNSITRKDNRENFLGPSMTFLVPAS